MTVTANTAPLPLSPAFSAGEFVFVSGQLAMRDGICTGGDIMAQTHAALDNIERILLDSGLTLDDIVKTTVWLTHAGDFAGFNAAYGSRFSSPHPARSTTVAQLLIEGARVEIEVVARRRPTLSVYATPALAD